MWYLTVRKVSEDSGRLGLLGDMIKFVGWEAMGEQSCHSSG